MNWNTIILVLLILIPTLILIISINIKQKNKLSTSSKNERYTPPVTMPLADWQNYVASGMNTLLGSGGVIPGPTLNAGWNTSSAVYGGHVRQGMTPGFN